VELPSFISKKKIIGSLPIVIGVTGHRDLCEEDIPLLRVLFCEVITDFQTRYPSTPLVLLSSLAEGADRLGARVAIEMGIEVIAPLPFPVDVYKKDFETEESVREFNELLSKVSRWFTVPLAEGVNSDKFDDVYYRNEQYGQVGGYIARYSQILVAFWDGKHLSNQGGTSSVVRNKLEGISELETAEQKPLDPPESGPVYHIITRRMKEPGTIGEAMTLKVYYPKGYDDEETADRSFHRIYQQIEQFNTDAAILEEKLVEHRKVSKKYMFPEEHYSMLSEALRATIENFTVADTLASYFQKFTTTAFKGLFLLVLLAAMFFDLYAHLYHEEKGVLVWYFVTLVAAFLWYDRARRKKFQTKYLDYRALAEGLRVQLYWQYAGIRNSASEYYMRKQKSELDWIRFALRTLAIPADDESLSNTVHSTESKMLRLEVTQKYWVEDQAKYYKKAMHRDHHTLHKFERMINIFFYIGVALAGLQMVIEPNHYLIVAIGLAPILAALLGSYIEKNGLVGHIKQYERMSALFSQANDGIKRFLVDGKRAEAIDYMFELGKEALAENGDWLLHHRERPLEVPKG
jgi:hypothetical protein